MPKPSVQTKSEDLNLRSPHSTITRPSHISILFDIIADSDKTKSCINPLKFVFLKKKAAYFAWIRSHAPIISPVYFLFFLYRCWLFPAFIRPWWRFQRQPETPFYERHHPRHWLRWQTFLAFPPPTSKHRLGVQSGVWSDFLQQRPDASSEWSGCCWSGFALRLWCATLNANLLKQRLDRGGRFEPHARPLPIPSALFWFVVLCNRFSRVGGREGNNTGENILLCLFRFYSHPSRKMSTITCWHIPQKHGLYVLHLSDKYPAYPWSLSTLVGNGRSGKKEAYLHMQ